MKGKYKIGDKVTGRDGSNDFGVIASVTEVFFNHSAFFYKVSFNDNGTQRISEFLPEYRIQKFTNQLSF